MVKVKNQEGRIDKGKDLARVSVTVKRESKGITRGGYSCEPGKIRFMVELIHPKMIQYFKSNIDWFNFKSSSGNFINKNKNLGCWVEERDLVRYLLFIDAIRDKINAIEASLEKTSKYSGIKY